MTREAYATAVPFPSAMFYPRNLRNQAFRMVYPSDKSLYNCQTTEEVDKKVGCFNWVEFDNFIWIVKIRPRAFFTLRCMERKTVKVIP